MTDDLDLRGIDRRHEPDPEFRAALRRRVMAIMEGSDPADGTEPANTATIDLEQASRDGEPRRRHRWITPAIAIASAAATVTLIVLVRSRDDGTSPIDIPPVSTSIDIPPVSTSIDNPWVAFSASDGDSDEGEYPDEDVYVVRQGSAPRRVAGSDTDELAQICPAFSPDASRLLFGQAEGSEGTAYQNAALVINDVTADGELAESARIPLGEEIPPPCGIWSADGRWVAFGVDAPLVQGPEDADGMNPREPTVHSVDEVWVVDTQSDDIRRLTGLLVTDLAWSPTATELAFIGIGISVYSVAADEVRPLGDPSGVDLDRRGQLAGAAWLDWSPDGQTIAFTDASPGTSDPYPQDIWLMDADGTNARILVPGINANHGIGPVWSPDGDRIAYQRLCDVNMLGRPCREDHEVVLVTVVDDDEPAGTEQVIPAPQTNGPDGPIWWYPFRVTWSPDGRALLYFAWSAAPETGAISRNGLVAVPLDGATPAVVLSGDLRL